VSYRYTGMYAALRAKTPRISGVDTLRIRHRSMSPILPAQGWRACARTTSAELERACLMSPV
jgi:hypothetical protein